MEILIRILEEFNDHDREASQLTDRIGGFVPLNGVLPGLHTLAFVVLPVDAQPGVEIVAKLWRSHEPQSAEINMAYHTDCLRKADADTVINIVNSTIEICAVKCEQLRDSFDNPMQPTFAEYTSKMNFNAAINAIRSLKHAKSGAAENGIGGSGGQTSTANDD